MKRNYSYGFGVVIATVLLCAAFSTYAAVPAVINYQSRLRTSGGAAITAATKVSFSLYSAATGGSALWTESYSQSSGACAKVAPDANGYFSVRMGSCDAFPTTLTFTTPLFLGVTIENDAEASPRVAFAPAPYAMNAVRVGNFVSDTSANTLTGESAGTATAGTQGFNSSGLALQGSGWNGSAAQGRGFKVRSTVTDASNYRLSFLNSSDGSESLSILQNGRVGIGIANPQSELEVAGVIYANDFRTRGGTISTTGDGTNDLIRFTRPKLFIGHTADLNVAGSVTQLMQLTPTDVTFLEGTSFNKLISVPSRQIKFGLNTFTFPVAAPSADGLVLTTDTDGALSWTTKSTGSVTFVGLSAPADFTVSGSPVTSAGTLGFTWKDQSPNEILAGPAAGSAVGVPSFRLLAAADIPNLDAGKIASGMFDVARGGTGFDTYAKGQIIYADAIDSLAKLGIGSVNQVLTVDATGVPVWKAVPTDAGGTVKSVAATIPASLLMLSGSPITDSGTLAFDLAPQSKNKVFAGPITDPDAKPSFRDLTSLDIPDLTAAKITSGTFASGLIPDLSADKITSGVLSEDRIPALDIATKTSGTLGVVRGGTGIAATAKGDIIFSDAINSLATLGIGSAGSILAVNSAGLPEWQVSATNGTVTSVSATAPSFLTVSGSPITDSGTLAIDLADQSATEIFAGPLSGTGKPAFRALASLDIPDLDAAKITSGVFAAARIPALASSSIPDLDASKITSGVFDIARIPNIPAANIAGVFASSSIPSIDASKIGSGILGTANGGTGLSAVGVSGTVLTSVGGVPAWAPVSAGLSGSGAFGQLAFWNASSTLSGNPNLIIDSVNSRLSIGTSASPATTLVVAGDTTVGGDVIPSAASAYDFGSVTKPARSVYSDNLGSATQRIKAAYIDELYIFGGAGGSGTSTISATQTVFNGIAYNWPSPPIPGNDVVLTTDTSGNLSWKNPTNLVPESGWRSLGGNVRLGVISDKVGIGTAAPTTKLDVVGDIQASGFLSSGSGQIKFGGATYNFPTAVGVAGQVLTASSSGALAWQTPASGVGGTGTVNTLPMFTGTSTISNSLVTQVGNEVRIQTGDFRVMATSTLNALNVGGTARLTGDVYLGGGIPSGKVVMVDAGMLTLTGGIKLNGPSSFLRGDINIGMPNGPEAGLGYLKINHGGFIIPIGAGSGKVLTSDAAGQATWQTPGSGIGGTGTVNTLSVFSATGTISDSFITQTANEVRILGKDLVNNATTTLNKLSVSGEARLPGNVYIGNAAAGTTLIVSAATTTIGGSFVFKGNGGIQYTSGFGLGKVLTSDANGNATWEAPAATLPASVASSTVLAGPLGVAGAPTFRQLTAVDVPALDVSKLTTGVLPVARGGTGLSLVGSTGTILTVTTSGLPAWLPAPVGETATFVGDKTITGSLSVQGGATGTGKTTGLSLGATAGSKAYVYRDGPRSVVIDTDGTGAAGNSGTVTLSADNVLIGRPGSANLNFIQLGAKTTDVIEVTGALKVGAAATQYTFPYDNGGAAGKVLTTIDAAGTLAWQTPPPPPSSLPDAVAAGTVLAGPISGGDGAPDFRTLTASDMPSFDAAKITSGTINAARLPALNLSASDIPNISIDKLTSGTLPVARGGTGLSSVGTNGQVLTVQGSVLGWTTPNTGKDYIDGGNSNALYVDNSDGVLRKLGSNSNSGTAANVSQLTLSSTSNTAAATTINNITGVKSSVFSVPVLTGITKNAAYANIYSEASNTMSFAVGGNPKMILKTSGLEVVGTVKSNGSTLTSDARLKKNIRALDGALEAISKLKAVYFDWKDEKLAASVGRQIGFIAQDVERVVPEVVSTDDKGYKGVAYGNLSALAIEGVKELDAKLNAAQPTAGTGVLEAGENAVVIRAVKASASAKIFVTPVGSTGGQALYVGDIVDGKYFTVKTDKVVRSHARFNWMIIE